MKAAITIFQFVVLIITTNEISAFLAPVSKTSNSVKLFADSQDGKESIKEGLVAAGSSLQSQLASAFSNLDESDQYDAVLTGLCAKILDEPSLSGDEVIAALKDSISLLEEMNARRVSAGSRSLMALVDVSTVTLHPMQWPSVSSAVSSEYFPQSYCAPIRITFGTKPYFFVHVCLTCSNLYEIHFRFVRQQPLRKTLRRWQK